MTISTTSNKVAAQGNGLTNSFNFNFLVQNATQLFVYFTNTAGVSIVVPSTQYSVSGIGSSNGGTVTYPLSGSPISTGTSLTIVRLLTYQQLTDLINQSGYYPEVVEAALDYLTMLTQQLSEAQNRALSIPVEAAGVSTILPTPVPNLGLGWDSTGQNIVNIDFAAKSSSSAAAAAASAAQALASQIAAGVSEAAALSSAAALNVANAQLATGIITFNNFDLGFVHDTPPATVIDLGTVH